MTDIIKMREERVCQIVADAGGKIIGGTARHILVDIPDGRGDLSIMWMNAGVAVMPRAVGAIGPFNRFEIDLMPPV